MTDDELLRAYEQGPVLVRDTLAGVPEDLLDMAPDPDRWSVHDNVIHLSDAELVYAVRIRRALGDTNPQLSAFDEDAWGSRLAYAQRDMEAALDLIGLLRFTTADLLRSARPDAWDQYARHAERGPMTVRDLVQACVDHVTYHVRNIEAIKSGGL